MIREWKDSIIFEFENGYKVSFKYVSGKSIAVPTRIKPEVVGPDNHIVTSRFLSMTDRINADEFVLILGKVKALNKNEELDIL